MSANTSPRIGLIGARRVRQGLGPFVARQLLGAGAQPVGCLGTSPNTCLEAVADLQASLDIELFGTTDWSELVTRTRPDAIAILCPPEHHGEYLERALEDRLHVLCEKPVTWTDDPEADARHAQNWVQRFRDRGLLLVENCQWPEVLPGVRALEPAASEQATSFGMGLEPAAAGTRMLGDALPHPLSLLQELAPGPATIEGIRCHWGPKGEALDLDFRWCGSARSLDAHIELRCTQRTPRGAWIELDGLRFDRFVRASDYALFLNCGPRTQQLEDPLERHLASFVRNLRATLAGAVPPDPEPIAERARVLSQLRLAVRDPLS